MLLVVYVAIYTKTESDLVLVYCVLYFTQFLAGEICLRRSESYTGSIDIFGKLVMPQIGRAHV